MKLSSRQERLLEFVKAQHTNHPLKPENAVRKYSDEPYWTHPLAVAEICYMVQLAEEVALCHDLFEDTYCDWGQLHLHLLHIGYNATESRLICSTVQELTDVFIPENFPYLNRKFRKQAEAKRLGSTSYLAQTVKYADLIHNTISIVDNDPGFARKYLQEKEQMLEEMTNGCVDLRDSCLYSLHIAKDKLK